MYKFIGLVLRIHLSLNASYSATKQSALSNKSSIPYLALCKGFFNTIKLHLQVSSSIMNSKVHFTWSSNFHTDPRNLVTICRCFVWVAMLTVLYNSFPSIVPHASFMGRKYGVIATTHDTVGYLTNQFGSQRKFGGSYYCIATSWLHASTHIWAVTRR